MRKIDKKRNTIIRKIGRIKALKNMFSPAGK
jgi:hypothetical protein